MEHKFEVGDRVKDLMLPAAVPDGIITAVNHPSALIEGEEPTYLVEHVTTTGYIQARWLDESRLVNMPDLPSLREQVTKRLTEEREG